MARAVLVLALLLAAGPVGLGAFQAQAQAGPGAPPASGLPAEGRADPLPRFAHTSVNDFAGILTPDDARAIDEALIVLHGQSGVEGTVVTLPDRARYGTETLERFAQRLFDGWGVGDARLNDGFMVLMIPSTREVRIELGAGYGRQWDEQADRILARIMLPAFRDGRLSEGLREGTREAIRSIAQPHAYGRPVPLIGGEGRDGGLLDWLMPLAVLGVFATTFIGIIRRKLRGNRAATCPQCGATLIEADPVPGAEAGTVLRSRRCPSCGWHSEQTVGGRAGWGGWRGGGLAGFPRTGGIDGSRSAGQRGNRASGGGRRGGGFGGGRSGGGGASGRW